MSISPFFVELLEGSLKNVFENLLERIQILRNNAFLPKSSNTLLIEIKNMIPQKRLDFNTIQKSYETQNDIEGRHTNLIVYFNLVNKFSVILNLIENSAATDFNPSVFYLIEDTISKLSDDIGIIINSCDDLNYYELNLKQYLVDVGILRKFFLVILPKYFKDDLFHLVLLYHEIGHFIDFDMNLSSIIEGKDKVKEEIKKINEKISIPKSDNIIDIIKSTLFIQNSGKIIKQWINELVADYIAIKIVGFPYFLSYCFIMAEIKEKDISSETHPPDWLRLKILKKIWVDEFERNLKDPNLISSVKDVMGSIDFILKSDEHSLPSDDPRYLEISKMMDEICLIIKMVIDNEFATLNITNDFDEIVILELKETLGNNIPPGDFFGNDFFLPKPVNFPSIINASWFFLIENSSNYNKVTRDLLLKSIENSYIKELFLKTQEDLTHDDIE